MTWKKFMFKVVFRSAWEFSDGWKIVKRQLHINPAKLRTLTTVNIKRTTGEEDQSLEM